MNNWIRIFLITAFIGFHVSCDQVSKQVAREQLNFYERVHIIPGHFQLVKVENTGAFLGMMKHLSEPFHTLLLKILPLLIVLGAIIWLLRTKDLPTIKALSLIAILGGGLGNLIDRIWLGAVTDFMQIKLWGWHTGVFNVADVSISIGFVVLVIYEFRSLIPGVTPDPSDGA